MYEGWKAERNNNKENMTKINFDKHLRNMCEMCAWKSDRIAYVAMAMNGMADDTNRRRKSSGD